MEVCLLPFTGKFLSWHDGSSTSVAHTVHQQQKYLTWGEPYETPAPYWRKKFHRRRVNNPNGFWVSATNSLLAADPALEAALRQAQAKAWDRFKSAAYDEANLAMLFIERKEALNMVASRAMQLYKAYRELRKGRFQKFLRALQIRPKARDKHRRWSRPKDAASVWLEYWFGWAPTISDIGGVIDILQSPYRSGKKVVGSARSYVTLEGNAGMGTSTRKWQGQGYVGARYQAYIEVENPNLFRANQLGFINPALVVWELIPFSFIVDWFIPVGDFLSSFTDFVGLRFTKPFHNYRKDVMGTGMWKEYSNEFVAVEEYYEFGRSLGVEPPKDVGLSPFKMSASRAATAVSLLITIFR